MCNDDCAIKWLISGYAFIKFESVEAQNRVILQRHQIGGRWCDVKIPDSAAGSKKKNNDVQPGFKKDTSKDNKIFVARIDNKITKDDLRYVKIFPLILIRIGWDSNS